MLSRVLCRGSLRVLGRQGSSNHVQVICRMVERDRRRPQRAAAKRAMVNSGASMPCSLISSPPTTMVSPSMTLAGAGFFALHCELLHTLPCQGGHYILIQHTVDSCVQLLPQWVSFRSSSRAVDERSTGHSSARGLGRSGCRVGRHRPSHRHACGGAGHLLVFWVQGM